MPKTIRRFSTGIYCDMNPGSFKLYIQDDHGNLIESDDWAGPALHFGDRFDNDPYLMEE